MNWDAPAADPSDLEKGVRCERCGRYDAPAGRSVRMCDDCYSSSGACCAGEASCSSLLKGMISS